MVPKPLVMGLQKEFVNLEVVWRSREKTKQNKNTLRLVILIVTQKIRVPARSGDKKDYIRGGVDGNEDSSEGIRPP